MGRSRPVGQKDDLIDEGSWRGARLPRRQDTWERRQPSKRLPTGPHWRQESESGAPRVNLLATTFLGRVGEF